MPAVQSALIHEFDAKLPPRFDVDGELLLGFYYQFVGDDDQPLYGLIGPYRHRFEAEGAAQLAFARRDF